MGIRQSIANLILPKEYKLGTPQAGGTLQFFDMQMPPGWGYQTYLRAYGEIGILYAVVNVIAQAVAKTEWHLFEIDKERNKTEIYEHEVLDLMRRVNPFQTRYQFIYLGTMYKLLVGEEFWQLNFNGKGRPAEMWQAPPAYMAVIPSRETYISHYVFKRQSFETKFTVDEIIHIKSPNPANEYRGLSPAQALTTDLDSERYASKYQQKLFFNEATPGLVIEYPADQLPPSETRKELQQEWDERFKGFRNRGKTAFLYGGKVNTVTMTNRDMDFNKLRLFTRDAICAAYHVPPSIVGITAAVNRSNAEASQYDFAQYCVHPELADIREALNEELLPFYGENLYLDFDNPVPEDKVANTNQAVALYKGGIIKKNEARIMVDLDPDMEDPEGESYYSEPAPTFGMPNQVPEKERPETPDEEEPKKPKETEEETEETKDIKKKTVDGLQYWKDYVSRAESYEVEAINQLQILFLKQKEQALNNLQAKKELINLEEYKKQYIEAMTPTLTQAMYMAIKNGRELLIPENPHKDKPSIPFVISPGALKWLKTRIGWAAEQVGEETAKLLADALAQGYELGESIDKLSQRVMAVFDQANKVRAKLIARTEVMQASAQGQVEGYKDADISKAEFYPAQDERECEDCVSIAETDQYGLGDGIFPLNECEGIITVHPNCRCCWLPVLD